ncbi:MAG TPA: hypothetical protein VF997_19780, partial [Polyangia bacterium]
KAPEVSAAGAARTAAATAAASPSPSPMGARRNFVPWAVAGGVALVLVVVLATSGRKKAEPVATAPPPPAPSKVVAAPAPTVSGVPESARRHLAQALDYQRRLWCSDALEELDKALRDDAALRDDPSLQRTAVACLTPKTRERAIRLLVERVGPGARAELERATAQSLNSEVRRGAAMALERLPR